VTIAIERPSLTAAQFLEWSVEQSKKFELENGEVIEMAAETAKHALMKHAATKALEAGIEKAGLNCTVFPDGMTVVVDDKHVRLPDAAIQCTAFDPNSIVLDAPLVLVEVMSPSSANRDENHKLVEYLSIPSVHHYLLLSPDQRVVVHFKRVKEARIETRILHGGQIDLTPPGFSVLVEDLLGKKH
jgi:Uma2 family endonuclease